MLITVAGSAGIEEIARAVLDHAGLLVTVLGFRLPDAEIHVEVESTFPRTISSTGAAGRTAPREH